MVYCKDFGGVNNVLVVVCDCDSDIFNKFFFDMLKNVYDELFFINGVNCLLVVFFYLLLICFIEIVEGGFVGGLVILVDFNLLNFKVLDIVVVNIEKVKIVGCQVLNNYCCVMVIVQLFELDFEIGEQLNIFVLVQELEDKFCGQFENDDVSIYIIGFVKMIGDVVIGVKFVVLFFVIVIVIIVFMVYFFFCNIMFIILFIVCLVIVVIWQMGLLILLGFGLDFMLILVLFLVFVIGVSYGV